MARTEYVTIKDSKTVVERNGIPRYDIFTFPINEITFNDPVLEYSLTSQDIGRFDLFIINTYGEASYYRKMVLWLNNIPILDESMIGRKIDVPSKNDLDRFLIKNIV